MARHPWLFQSALPRGERQDGYVIGEARNNFNPRSREGSDFVKCFKVPSADISIRAPARGATQERSGSRRSTMISIRAPARGATAPGGRSSDLYRYFNPRSREGSDQIPHQSSECSSISIRAPARGATEVIHNWYQKNVFQSALPRGERPIVSVIATTTIKNFNPRSREGSDCLWTYCIKISLYFNPRSREGSDQGGCTRSRQMAISIRAPARGATTVS